MAKTFMRRSKCDKSTLRKIEIIVRRGYYRKPRSAELSSNRRYAAGGERD
jgi:hypothetical protein